ncbi:Vms1/Ankzf1 family peptidyl-tRNA hydrolase [Actinoallomurus acanthiterrae]
MDVTFLKSLYDIPGPFASVYLDMRRATEDAAKVIELRWRALHRELVEQGTPAATVEAIERVVAEENIQRESGTLAVFAADGEAVHSEVLSGTPRAELARYAPLPHVKPLLAQRGHPIAYLVARVDRLGGEITCVSRGGDRRTITVKPDEDFPVRKTKAGDMFRQDKQQRAAEEVWRTNAKKVAHAIVGAVDDCCGDIVILAGDVRARTAVQEELSEPVLSRVVDAGGAGPTLDEEITRAVELKRAEHLTSLVSRFDEQLTKHGRAVEGMEGVTDALRKGQVACLFLEDRPDSSITLWTGPQATDVATSADRLRELGVADPVADLADAALIRALARTDGELVLLPPESLRAESGAGALLRYAD